MLGYGSFMLLGGRTSDPLSRRTVFLTAVTVFDVASVMSAPVSSELPLVALRSGAAVLFTLVHLYRAGAALFGRAAAEESVAPPAEVCAACS